VKGKIRFFDWDFINSKDDSETYAICLTWAERQILLTMVDYIGWGTRWIAYTGTVDTDKIEAWCDGITKKLIEGCDVIDNCTEVWACLGITGTPPTDLESWLIDQLTDNADTINAINNLPVNTTTPSPIATEVMAQSCDKDNAFAFSLQLVQFIHLAISDFFELVESVTNSAELAQIVLKVPVLQEVSEFVDYLQEELAEEYLAEYTTTLENTYACEVMCLIITGDNCEATWLDLYTHFLERFGAGVENINIIDLLYYIGGGGFSGTVFCDAAFAAFCGVMYYGDVWLDITLSGIKRFWDSWINDSNSDWSVLCDVCQWTRLYDFRQDCLDGFVVVSGQWATSTALYSSGTSPFECEVDQSYGTSFDGLNKLSVFCGASGTDQHTLTITVTHGSGQEVDVIHPSNGESWKYVEYATPLDSVSYVDILFQAGGAGNSVAIREIKYEGVGDNPASESECDE
jgi:hypothetical protein